MKLVVFTDVHANFPALRAALAAFAKEGADALAHTGDVLAVYSAFLGGRGREAK